MKATIIEENGIYIANFDSLEVSSQGNTPEEAMENLVDAVMLFIEGCQEMGTLEVVLRELIFGEKNG